VDARRGRYSSKREADLEWAHCASRREVRRERTHRRGLLQRLPNLSDHEPDRVRHCRSRGRGLPHRPFGASAEVATLGCERRYGAFDVRVENVPDAQLVEPTDAVVTVTRAGICGSDLWPYKSMEPSETGRRMGHEFVGVVEDVGGEVRSVKAGDFVISPFLWCDGTCVFCREGLQTSCLHGGRYGDPGVDGGQGEAVRVPQADGTLVVLESAPDDALLPSLVTLTDVMSTGHHAALAARVGPGKAVAVVGDGAVGLCGVIASKRLGAERVILLGRHRERTALGRDFGADEKSRSAARRRSRTCAS
jgi:threonine dehydrogenase-like Zn-dependent dehydrogenase